MEGFDRETGPSMPSINNPAGDMPKYYRSLVDILCRLSEAHYYQGNLTVAVTLLDSNIHILTTGEVALEDRARFQTQRGKMLYYQAAVADADSEPALAVLLQAQELAQSARNDAYLAKALHLIGMVFYSRAFSTGDFEKPREYLLPALDLRQRLEDRQGICETLFYLGLTYQNRNDRTTEDRQAALRYYQQALELAQAGGFKLEESYLVRHLAAEEEEEGNWEKALAGFERSLALREEIGYKVYQPTALLTLGEVHQAARDLDQALRYFQRAYELAAEMNASVYMLRAQIAMGDAEKQRADDQRALQHYENALQVAKSASYQKGIAQATAKIAAMPRTS